MREQEEDSDGEETEEISFKHGCVECGHVIGEHFYREITEASGVTRFLMECPLCGKGAHEKPSYSTPSTSAGMAAAADAAARQVGGEGIIEDEADEWAEEEN
eukprot:CAMPEP_0171866134 /NCGR_PEP_ID=MMETSP0992-20121227/30060_1 /TAXON_ID=483369 /ORGANISM="non described non described, Strain CCMP2098" /LENGTH=101 /DNA_ID=CAMNT_0012489415 /DNA_START=201 /DNA_END=506 /DNA_ORIENTATION=+